MKVETLKRLLCPYCGSGLEPRFRSPASGPEIEAAILACTCGEFPLLGGIPIFQREGRIDVMRQTVDAPLVEGPAVSGLLALIRAGSADEALMRLLVWPEAWAQRALAAINVLPKHRQTGPRHLVEKLGSRKTDRERRVFRERPTARDAMDSYARQSGKAEHFHHFYHRFAQPRHLSGLAVVRILPQGPEPSLDLACGFGHTLHSWTASRPKGSFFGVDRNFISLYIARRWVAPLAEYVCARGDERLPFPDGFFGAILCADSFHCFLRKRESAVELSRLLAPEGVLAITRFGNALIEPREGYELDPEGYARLFEGLQLRFLRDPDTLAGYLAGRLPNLAADGQPESVAELKWISLIASRAAKPFRDYGPLGDWPHGLGRLRVNPLYKVVPQGDGVALQFEFPSKWFEYENKECRAYMPERIELGRQVLEDIEAQRRTPQVEELIRRCVVLGLPEGYG